MAAFAPSTEAIQSDDGLTVTFTDNSNYSSNDEGYIKSQFTTNTIVIKDANGVVLQTSNFLTSDTVTYVQTADTWFTTVRTLAGVASYTKTEKFGLHRMTTNKFEDALTKIGCCASAKDKSNMCMADAFLFGADMALPVGNSVKWQQNVNSSNSYLDLIV